MAERTDISWADATLNFWVGCTKVSVGEKGACEFCYAETWAMRWPKYRETWGVGAERVRTVNTRGKALALERLAVAKAARGEGAFFCFSNSLSDIFDKEVPTEWLIDAFADMRAAPHVTFLLLTKRAPNIVKRIEAAGGLPPNAALGITAVTQAELDRDVWHLLKAKRRFSPAFVFLSIEPMMEEMRLWVDTGADGFDYLTGAWYETDDPAQYAGSGGGGGHSSGYTECVDWVIVGFESGAKARPPIVAAARSVRDQCAKAGTPFHFKQWGAWHADALAYTDMHGRNPPPNMKVGPKKSGRLLDGVIHDARPEVRVAA